MLVSVVVASVSVAFDSETGVTVVFSVSVVVDSVSVGLVETAEVMSEQLMLYQFLSGKNKNIRLCIYIVCLFVLRLNVPVNNFSVMSGRSQRFLGLTSTVGSRCALLKDTTR